MKSLEMVKLADDLDVQIKAGGNPLVFVVSGLN